MDFGEIFCAGRASEKEKLLRAIPKRLFTDVGLSWRTFAYGEILCIWTRNNQCRALLPCRPREIFLGPTLLALNYGLGKFRHWIYGRRIFFSLVCGHCKLCALPLQLRGPNHGSWNQVVFVGGGSRGTSPSLDLTFPPTGLSEM